MLSQMRAHVQSWWQQIPLPKNTVTPNFQKWYSYDQQKWMPFVGIETSRSGIRHSWAGSFRLVSWNVNAHAPSPQSRISALVHVIQTTGGADVIFLQEVSREALITLLLDPWIQQNCYISDVDVSASGNQNFTNVTLVFKHWIATHGILLGAIWRIPLPSHFGRDALCCDSIFNTSSKHMCGRISFCIRLINVHLDSLPITPSLRPRQLSICTSYLRAAGRGVIAGDFNPVLPEDDAMVCTNGLVDAWQQLHPNNSGYTWGVDDKQAFPPNRLDKVALFNLTASAMDILQTREVGFCCGKAPGEVKESGPREPFSDHLGLWSHVAWTEHDGCVKIDHSSAASHVNLRYSS